MRKSVLKISFFIFPAAFPLKVIFTKVIFTCLQMWHFPSSQKTSVSTVHCSYLTFDFFLLVRGRSSRKRCTVLSAIYFLLTFLQGYQAMFFQEKWYMNGCSPPSYPGCYVAISHIHNHFSRLCKNSSREAVMKCSQQTGKQKYMLPSYRMQPESGMDLRPQAKEISHYNFTTVTQTKGLLW